MPSLTENSVDTTENGASEVSPLTYLCPPAHEKAIYENCTEENEGCSWIEDNLLLSGIEHGAEDARK